MLNAIATGQFTTIADIRRKNQALGHHWFDRSTIEFFKTRFESDIIAGRFFITSEQPPHGKREYAIRRANDDGSIVTLVRPLRECPSDADVIMFAGMSTEEIDAELAENWAGAGTYSRPQRG